MALYKCKRSRTGKEWIETSLRGKPLLTTPQLNKGMAFTKQERIDFELVGKLPLKIESLHHQVARCYQQFLDIKDPLQRNIYLQRLHDTNQVLFYKLVSAHLMEILPTIYTPMVGSAVKLFSRTFRQSRGLYIAYPEREHMRTILRNRTNPEVDIIVVSDGEGVLGIGDQGIGGMDIPVAKLMVYTLCGGINHLRTLPIFLDTGTNNQTLLDDPFYLGWRHKRIRGKQYDLFIEDFVAAVKEELPHVFLHWEDFGRANADRILKRFRSELCTFNDDVQGTGAVALAACLAGVKAQHSSLDKQRIVVFGGGSAGMGITQQLYNYLLFKGISPENARKCFWIIDRAGLLSSDLTDLTAAQQAFTRDHHDIAHWKTKGHPQLLDVIHQVKPTILITCAGVYKGVTQKMIEAMASYVDRPIILPLSNPTERCELTANEIYEWTNGRAIVATGGPTEPVAYQGKTYKIAQCNNALIFPGVGLGVLAAKANRVTDHMMMAAALAVARHAPILRSQEFPLLPSLSHALIVSKAVAIAVAKQAIKDKVAKIKSAEDITKRVKDLIWDPHYAPLKRVK